MNDFKCHKCEKILRCDCEDEALSDSSQFTCSKSDLLELLMDWAELKGWEPLPKNETKLNHGSCCVCQDCGFHYDECVCQHNEILQHLSRISNVKNESQG